MPGNIKLADAMRTLIVTVKNDGYELESIAGKAFYGVSGIRGKVEGIPEYFPISLSVKDESNPVPKAELSKVQPGLDEQVSAQLTQISNADTSITSLASGLDKANADITRKTTSCLGTLTSRPIVELTDAANDVLYALFFRGALASGDLPAKSGAAELRSLGFAETGHVATKYQGEDYFTWLTSAGQAFAIGHLVKTRFGKLNTSHTGSITSLPFSVPASAMSELQAGGAGTDKGSIGAAHICGNTIEQETLSGVLTNTLHHVNPKEASDVALKLASAVKLAFNTLDFPPGGFAKNQPSQALFNEHPSRKGQPSSPLKAGTLGDEANVSTLTLKLELDTSDVCKQMDEVYDGLIERIKESSGKLFKAINQSADNTGLQALSSRISHLECALVSQGSQITALQAKHARTC